MGVGSTLDTVDEARYLGEERVVVGVDVSLLVVVSRSSDVQRGGLVWVDQPHVVAIGPDLKLARVGSALQSDGVGERTNGAVVVFPKESRQFSSKVADTASTHQTAEVRRGIRSSSGILDSSIGIFDSCPGFS